MSRPGYYTTKQAAKMLGLSEAQIRAFVKAGFIAPERDGKSLVFSFQELVLLRTAKGLAHAKLAPGRVKSALRKLREQLPQGRPLSTVTISAEAGRVVVRDERSRWRPEDGQLLFDFEVRDLAKKVAPIVAQHARIAKVEGRDAEEWYALGCELELSSIDEARDAYRRATELQPSHADAHCNLGRLLHEAGQADAAMAHYTLALEVVPDHSTALYNMGVVLEDAEQSEAAVALYERALVVDPGNADAHFNAARLYQKLDRPILALRHLRAYEKLL